MHLDQQALKFYTNSEQRFEFSWLGASHLVQEELIQVFQLVGVGNLPDHGRAPVLGRAGDLADLYGSVLLGFAALLPSLGAAWLSRGTCQRNGSGCSSRVRGFCSICFLTGKTRCAEG